MRIDGLTAKQLEVARLVADGHTTKRIAQSLGISDRAVQFHIERIARAWKLTDDKDTRVQIARRYVA